MTSDRRTTLLLGDGLSPGADAKIRERLVEHVMKDFARARKAQSRAVRAWIVHSALFALFWAVHVEEYARVFSRLFGSHIGVYSWTWSRNDSMAFFSNIEGAYKIGDVVLSALYFLNGIAFVIAILFTMLYFMRSRGAESSMAMMDLLAKTSQ